jgi:HK97 family phage portal protein
MIAEAAASIPVLLYDGPNEIETHPLLDLIGSPSPHQTGPEFLESFFGYLLVSGNAYVEAVALNGQLRELHVLRPDRMTILPGPDGWPEGYTYTAAGGQVTFSQDVVPGVRPILHMRLFHPVDDHYGLSPLEAAATAIDSHNQASRWNKALLDNAARPSGALVYAAREGRLSPEQFERLKAELQDGFQGAKNAGRPLLLEGGLDWKPLSLTPAEMDFTEAKHSAAREIALALGVPPMLLGIPGDNTFSNYAEAQRTFWRNTVLPLSAKAHRALADWLVPAYGTTLQLRADLDQIEALAPERDALWTRLEKANFLTEDEKRAAAGYGPKPGTKFNPGQPRVPAGSSEGGQWVGDLIPVAGPRSGGKSPPKPPAAAPPAAAPPPKPGSPAPPTALPSPPKKLEDILKPGGQDIGSRDGRATPGVRTVSPSEFEELRKQLLDGAKEVPASATYDGKWFERADGTKIGVRNSPDSGPTIEVVEGKTSGLKNGYKVHKR